MTAPPGAGTFLVADDEPVILALLARLLSRPGWRVLTAASGEETERLASERSPDLILLDAHMPGEGGLAALRHIRGDRRTAGIPVILLTGDDAAGAAAGADDCVLKPFDPAELKGRVDALLRRDEPQT